MALSRKRKGAKFPAEMAQAKRWTRADGKRPVMPNGRAASSTNPATWSTLGAVQSGAGDGYGFMLGDGFGCYDLDNAAHRGVIKAWARQAIANIPEPVIYTELSQSGEGLHIFVLANESPGERKCVGDGTVERYAFGRFIRAGTPFKP